MFEDMDFPGQAFRAFVGVQRHPGLEYMPAMVITLIHLVDGDAAFRFAGLDHGFVDMHSIHALAAVLGQQGRVDIQDAALVGIHQGGRDFPQEPRQYDIIDPGILQCRQAGIAPEKPFFFDHQHRNTRRFGDADHTGSRFIAAHQADPDQGMSIEVADNFPGIGAGARGKNGQCYHERGIGPKLYLFAMSRMMQYVLFFLFCLPVSPFAQSCPERAYPQPDLSADTRSKLEAQLQEAWTAYVRDSSRPDKIIWYGRRLAYLGRYTEAIRVFSWGIQLHPEDARFLRHRGHRYITVRCNPSAIADFSRAAAIEKGRPDQLEPDGMPNARNIPTSTLQTNIFYHMGLAYYLEKDFSRAADAWKACRELSGNPDMYMAAAYWEYISRRRAGQEQAAKKLLLGLDTNAQLIENEDYYALLMLYRGVLTESAVLEKLQPSAGSLSNATAGYALGVYYLLTGNEVRARDLWKQVLEGRQWGSFGYISAEKE